MPFWKVSTAGGKALLPNPNASFRQLDKYCCLLSHSRSQGLALLIPGGVAWEAGASGMHIYKYVDHAPIFALVTATFQQQRKLLSCKFAK